jgi:opacity protein-like surface antigen
MGFRRTLALAFGALGILGAIGHSAAARDDSPDDVSPYPPSGFFVFDWSGPYVGATLGLAHTQAESTETVSLVPDDPFFDQSLNYDQSESSFAGGVYAGWQKHWGKMVLGGEVGFILLRFDTDQASPLIAELGEPGVDLTRSVEVRDIFTLTGRLGYADGRWLAYFKGGVANAEVDAAYREEGSGASSSSSGREFGWTAGLGMEYALTHNMVLGIEYNYLHFRADVSPPDIPDLPVRTGDVDVDIQTLMVRLNYRLDFGCCPAGP